MKWGPVSNVSNFSGLERRAFRTTYESTKGPMAQAVLRRRILPRQKEGHQFPNCPAVHTGFDWGPSHSASCLSLAGSEV